MNGLYYQNNETPPLFFNKNVVDSPGINENTNDYNKDQMKDLFPTLQKKNFIQKNVIHDQKYLTIAEGPGIFFLNC